MAGDLKKPSHFNILRDATDATKCVTVTTDGSKERLDVNTIIAGVEVGVIPIGDRCHILDETAPISHPTTLATHTVNTGKIFYIFGWRINTKGGIFDIDLEIAGSAVDAMRQDNSAFTSVGSGTVDYGLIPIKATAGQVIRIQTVSGDTNKEIKSFFWGIEVDA